MKLFFRKMGQGPCLMILHGLYGSSDNWLTIAKELSRQYEVFIPDLRNHGRSPHHPEHTYPAMRDDILELMLDQQIGTCTLIGHSMGGKTALHVATLAPHKIDHLIIDDIAPVNYTSLSDYSELAIEHLNIMNALKHTNLDSFTHRSDIEKEWAGAIPDPNVRRFLLKNIQRDNDNRFTWRLNVKAVFQNLPHILNGMDQLGFDSGTQILLPALFIKGERSPYIREDMFPYIHQIFPDVRIVTIPRSGHWVHAEQPQLFLDSIRHFLDL